MTQQQKKILIVDDKSVNRYILSGIFEDEYDIAECADGSEAIAALEENGGRYGSSIVRYCNADL